MIVRFSFWALQFNVSAVNEPSSTTSTLNQLRLAAVVHYGIGKDGVDVTLKMFTAIAKV